MTKLKKLITGYYSAKKSVAACQKFFDLCMQQTGTTTNDKGEEKAVYEPIPGAQAHKDYEFLLEEAFYSVLPVLGIIIRNHFKGLQDDDLDDLMQLGSMEYWKILSAEKKPQPYSPSAHFNLYYKVGIRAMLKAMHQNKPVIYDFFANNALPPVGSYNFTRPEQEIFLQELPFILYDSVMEKVGERFDGDEYEVCDYIARCLIFQEDDIKRFQIRKIGGKITNAQFFEDYVGMRIKDALLKLKETTDISDFLTDEGAALNAMYYMTPSQASQTTA